MKTIYTLFFCLCCFYCYPQKNSINKLDSLGIKQGYWIEYDSLAVEGYSVSEQITPDSLGKSDCQYFVATKHKQIKHVGLYSNGNKTGVWKLFKGKSLWMKVSYSNGDRVKIEVLFSNGKPLYVAEKVSNENFVVKEYSKKGLLIKEKYEKVEFINNTEEVKLFAIGF